MLHFFKFYFVAGKKALKTKKATEFPQLFLFLRGV